MHKLNVMHLVRSLDMGGMENGVVNICHRLPRDEFSPLICTLQAGGALEKRLDQQHVSLIHVPKSPGRDLTFPIRLAKCLRRHRVDILHTHNWATLLEGLAASIIARVQVRVHGEHGKVYDRYRQILAQRWALRRVTQVLAVSSNLADRFAASIRFPRDSIHVLPNGVDTQRFHPADRPANTFRRQLGLPDNSLLIGMVARFVEFKNHAGLIRAFARIEQERKNAHLLFAGEGPLESELRQLMNSLALSDRVHFLGNVDQVEPLLQQLDVLVSNSSHCEGMSNAILEAMASGVPVVATRIAASPELLDDGAAGLLIPPNDEAALAEALERLVADRSLRVKFSNTGRRRAVDRFSMTSMLDAYADLYRSLTKVPSITTASHANQTCAASVKSAQSIT